MQEPTFTVVIPLYNKEDYIVKSVQSVLNQTFIDFELLVIDDGSSDSSLKKLQGISDLRLRIIKKKNGGVSSARNFGINHARGKYVAFLDADDEYEENYLREVELLFNRFPESSAAATAFFIKRGQLKTRCVVPQGVPEKGMVITDFFTKWSMGAFFFTSSITVKTEYFKNNNKWFPEGESMGEDQEIWFHLAEYGAIAYIPMHLSNYNIEVENSLTRSSKLTEELPFVTRLRATINGEKQDRSKLLFLQKYDLERAVNNALVGNKKLAFSILRKHCMSFEFLKLRCMLFALLVLPRAIIDIAIKLKRQHRQ